MNLKIGEFISIPHKDNKVPKTYDWATEAASPRTTRAITVKKRRKYTGGSRD